MTVKERTDAIRRFREHEIEALTRAGERERQRREDLARWTSASLPTINQFVHRVSEDFVDRGSPFLLSSVSALVEGSAIFRVKTSEGHRLIPKLQFDLADGQVTATSTVPGADLPSTVPLGDVTSEWVEHVAETVLIAMLTHDFRTYSSRDANARGMRQSDGGYATKKAGFLGTARTGQNQRNQKPRPKRRFSDLFATLRSNSPGRY